jgi:hypothetical protein
VEEKRGESGERTRTREGSVETHSIHLTHGLLAVVALACHPVAVEVREEPVDIVRARRVVVPLGGVVPEERFVQCFGSDEPHVRVRFGGGTRQ